MKKIFIITGLIVLWVMAWMWLNSPQGVAQVDRVLFTQDRLYAQEREKCQGKTEVANIQKNGVYDPKDKSYTLITLISTEVK